MQSSLTTSLRVRGLAIYLVLLRPNNYLVSVKYYDPMHNLPDFKLGFGVRQCQKRAGLNGYSMVIPQGYRSHGSLLQLCFRWQHNVISVLQSSFPANLRTSQGIVLLPQEEQGTDCPLATCLSPLFQVSFTLKDFTKLNLKYLDGKSKKVI